MNLDTSAQTQNLQSSIKAADLESFLHLEFTRSDKTWSDKPTSAHTTSFAEGLLQVEYERSQKKSVKRVGQKTFHVEMMDADNNTSASEVTPYDVDDMDDFQHVPIPNKSISNLINNARYIVSLFSSSRFLRSNLFVLSRLCSDRCAGGMYV